MIGLTETLEKYRATGSNFSLENAILCFDGKVNGCPVVYHSSSSLHYSRDLDRYHCCDTNEHMYNLDNPRFNDIKGRFDSQTKFFPSIKTNRGLLSSGRLNKSTSHYTRKQINRKVPGEPRLLRKERKKAEAESAQLCINRKLKKP